MPKKAGTNHKDFKFEAAMAELETLVSDLEKGDLPLDDALNAFDQGIGLVQQCQKTLKNAELRIEKVLTNDAGKATRTELFPEE